MSDVIGKLRDQLDAVREENESLRLAVAEAAQKEVESTRIIQRQHKEMHEVKRQLELERLRLEGLHLELQTRHYELPFIAANLDALLSGYEWPPSVLPILQTIQQSVKQMMAYGQDKLPTLDPQTWVALARKLGTALSFQARRTPVLSGVATGATTR